MASAWALLVIVIVLVVSGWGITQTGIIYRLTGGLVDRRLADAIKLMWTPKSLLGTLDAS